MVPGSWRELTTPTLTWWKRGFTDAQAWQKSVYSLQPQVSVMHVAQDIKVSNYKNATSQTLGTDAGVTVWTTIVSAGGPITVRYISLAKPFLLQVGDILVQVNRLRPVVFKLRSLTEKAEYIVMPAGRLIVSVHCLCTLRHGAVLTWKFNLQARNSRGWTILCRGEVDGAQLFTKNSIQNVWKLMYEMYETRQALGSDEGHWHWLNLDHDCCCWLW